MAKRFLCLLGLLAISAAPFVDAQTPPPLKSRGLLLKSASTKDMVETARSHQWSIDFTKREKDTLHIIAVRVEFQPDTSTLTTGNGLFGMQKDNKEQKFYDQDTVYKFDRLYHDSLYFAHQLAALRNYYDKVSRGNLTLGFSVYPSGSGQTGYRVPNQMTDYSPGWKKKRENIDQYWDRKMHGLMAFVRDAVKAAGDGAASPFRNLYRDDAGILRDSGTNRKAVVLIFHAGASYLTDGGMSGEADSPSDMIDAFINQDYFKFFKDTLGLDTTGITVAGSQGPLMIDEVMMCSETSNQDGLNWGIQGILVNQMARQLGIPDLFSTSSGISAIGAFCIMDFAGYSAGRGFIPPYPSAWVRAFMGWDKPAVINGQGSYNVKALTSVLDRKDFSVDGNGDDATILLIPINNNEYYLVENRQRNLSGDKSLFNYDDDGVISAYPYNVNVSANVKTLSDTRSNVILEAKNNDISLPASGMLVWHVDERIIRQRLPHNFVNADSSYRGVRLVEADGANDLGVTFVNDAFYQIAFDYGGAEDVFPHRVMRDGKTVADVWGFGPYSRPSTRSNDGGHTYIDIKFNRSNAPAREERSQSFRNNVVINYSDSVFTVDVKYDYITPGWPRRAAPDNFYDPLVTGIAVSPSSTGNNGSNDTVLTLLGESGRLYLYSIKENGLDKSYGNRSVNISMVDYHGKPVNSSITVTYFDSIPGTFTFPTAIDGKIFIPSSHENRHVINVYNSVNINDMATMPLPAAPSSYVCGIGDGKWAVGLADGSIVTGLGTGDINIMEPPSMYEYYYYIDIEILQGKPLSKSAKRKTSLPKTAGSLSAGSPVCAIAALKAPGDASGSFAIIQNDGTLSIRRNSYMSAWAKVKNGIPPFTLVTGDLDNCGESEIVVSDSRQGVWVYKWKRRNSNMLELAQGWNSKPNDWANTYHIDTKKPTDPSRERFVKNHSAPALADLNRNGNLDIVVSGTNGVYALNCRGALLSRWPAYLDNRYWNLRGTVTTSPIVVSEGKNQPLVLFSSPTGERVTFGITKIETADKESGVVTFRRENGTLDSLWDLSAATIDTILTIGDSLVYPYIMPGGFVDALNGGASRPVEKIGGWAVPQSRWPLSMGAPVSTSPLVCRMPQKAGEQSSPLQLFAASSDGMVYRWQLAGILADTLYWPQNGFDAARSFAYGGPVTRDEEKVTVKEVITFWNYPNPTSKDDPQTTFKYQFNGKAENVRLDIYTITGYRMDTFHNLPGHFPDWNEFKVNLRKYGPGIYRCRMEATISGKKYSKVWKMAVVK